MERQAQGTLRNYKDLGIFYRVHWSDSPEFCEDNAYSNSWGSDFNEEEAARGYSCCSSPEELYDYFHGDDNNLGHGDPDPNEKVVIFWGKITGWGPDGEPLVVPFANMRARWTTWSHIVDNYKQWRGQEMSMGA